MNNPEKFFDRVASKSNPESNKTAKKVIELTEAYLEKNYAVLDFGCGSGTITNNLAKSAQSIEGIDISSKMLEFAQQQTDELSITNVNYRQISIFDDQLKEESFDAIVAFNVLHYIDDMPALMDRVHSLLKPNGVFISSTACMKEKRSFLRTAVYLAMKLRVLPKIQFYKTTELESLITNGTFSLVKSEKISKLPEQFILVSKDDRG